jgi:hypothetical protein
VQRGESLLAVRLLLLLFAAASLAVATFWPQWRR